jgi:hypothetical protein
MHTDHTIHETIHEAAHLPAPTQALRILFTGVIVRTRKRLPFRACAGDQAHEIGPHIGNLGQLVHGSVVGPLIDRNMLLNRMSKSMCKKKVSFKFRGTVCCRLRSS